MQDGRTGNRDHLANCSDWEIFQQRGSTHSPKFPLEGAQVSIPKSWSRLSQCYTMHAGNLPAQTQAGRRQERNHHQSPVTSLPAWSIKGRETSPLNLVLPPPHIIVMHWWCSRQVVSGSCNPMDCKAIVHARLL